MVLGALEMNNQEEICALWGRVLALTRALWGRGAFSDHGFVGEGAFSDHLG